MDNIELAKICANIECRFCKDKVKKECLKNKCWSSSKVKDRKCPAVYYGILGGARNVENH